MFNLMLLGFSQTDNTNSVIARREHQDVKLTADKPDCDIPVFTVILAVIQTDKRAVYIEVPR